MERGPQTYRSRNKSHHRPQHLSDDRKQHALRYRRHFQMSRSGQRPLRARVRRVATNELYHIPRRQQPLWLRIERTTSGWRLPVSVGRRNRPIRYEIFKCRSVRLLYRLHFGMRLVVSARTPRPPRRLPMASEHLEITEDMLSPYSKSFIDPLHLWQPSKKLVPNLINKQKYVCHYRNLQFYLNHGLKLDKIHRIISFTQSPWLKPWIDLCTEQRKTAWPNCKPTARPWSCQTRRWLEVWPSPTRSRTWPSSAASCIDLSSSIVIVPT